MAPEQPLDASLQLLELLDLLERRALDASLELLELLELLVASSPDPLELRPLAAMLPLSKPL